MRSQPDPVGPGQEGVCAYPRPAVAEPSGRHVHIEHRGVIVADTRKAIRTLETSHSPSWYLPPNATAPGLLRESDRRSFCEWKGQAAYCHLEVGGMVLRDVALSYPDPTGEHGHRSCGGTLAGHDKPTYRCAPFPLACEHVGHVDRPSFRGFALD